MSQQDLAKILEEHFSANPLDTHWLLSLSFRTSGPLGIAWPSRRAAREKSLTRPTFQYFDKDTSKVMHICRFLRGNSFDDQGHEILLHSARKIQNSPRGSV
ncbi:hypothetical protein C8J56DRAFT_897061 [Mycena floridula]|nr:hypothetical protein C8J56DRAFT_897061 [Mycena floridula]